MMKESISFYDQIMIISNISAPAQATVSLVGVLGSAFATIMCNIISVKMYNVLPLNMYLLAPFWSIVLLIILNLVLKYGSQYELVSKEMLRRWRKDVRLVKMGGIGRVYARQVVARRPVRFFIGVWNLNLLPVDRSLLCDYDTFIAESTMAWLVAFDKHK